MTPIKILLLLSFIGLGWMFLRTRRSLLVDRVIVLLTFSLASVAVFFPDTTTEIAKMLGVGRGADLILYLFVVGVGYCLILLYGKIARLRAELTTVVRHLAHKEAAGDEQAHSG